MKIEIFKEKEITTDELGRMCAKQFSSIDEKFEKVDERLGNIEQSLGNLSQDLLGLRKSIDWQFMEIRTEIKQDRKRWDSMIAEIQSIKISSREHEDRLDEHDKKFTTLELARV